MLIHKNTKPPPRPAVYSFFKQEMQNVLNY